MFIRKSAHLLRLLILSLALLTLTGCGIDLAGEPQIISTIPPAPPQPTRPADVGYPSTAADIALGASIFAESCVRCHGIGGAGDGELVLSGQVTNPTNMTDRASVVPDVPKDWFDTITNGNLERLMPPWGATLTEDERWALTFYTYTLHYSQAQIERGAALYAQECAACHGDDGRGGGAEALEKNLDPGDLTDPRSMATLSDEAMYISIAEGIGDKMPALNETLSEQEIWDTVAYTRTLSLANTSAIGTTVAQEIAEPAATQEATPVLEAVVGRVSGNISNGTEGGSVPAQLEVVLHTLNANLEIINSQEGTATDGAFSFDDITLEPAQYYVAVVSYNQRQFISPPQLGSNVQDGTLSLSVQIFDATDDSSVISIVNAAYQVSVLDDRLQVLEVVVFRNNSDRLYSQNTPVDAEGRIFGSVVLDLPPGAIIAGFGSAPERYIVDETTFTVTDTQPVFPNDEHVLQVVYFLPFERAAIIEHPIRYALNGAVRLLVSPTQTRIDSLQFPFVQNIAIRDTLYGEYGTNTTLAAGEVLRYEVIQAEIEGALPSWLPWVFFSLAGIAAIAAVVLAISTRNKPAAATDPTRTQIDALLTEIAALDEAHEQGKLDTAAWESAREVLKTRVKTLMHKDEQA